MYLKALVVSCLCAGVLSQSTGQSENNGVTSEENGGKIKRNENKDENGEGRKRKKKDKRTETKQSSSNIESDSTIAVKKDSKPQDVAEPREENSGQVAGNEVKSKRKRKDKESESKNTNTGETEQVKVAPSAQAEQEPNTIPQNTAELEPSNNLYKPLFYMFFTSLGLFLFYFFGIKRLNGNPPVSMEKTPLYTHIEDAETGNTGEDEGWEEEDWGGSKSKEKSISTHPVPSSNSSISSNSSNGSSNSNILNSNSNDGVNKKTKEMPEKGTVEGTTKIEENRTVTPMKPRSPPATVNTDYFSTIGIAAAPKFKDKVPSNNSLSSKNNKKDKDSRVKYNHLEGSEGKDKGAWGNDDELDV
mmetsp:Transcript_16632/g.15990  ORF Transcript_16632/g.15990 Transcript_16632/m.15990 type:complete len:359 (+) Transcript_16632:142-1218(+)|eukprot:CAMPEP_0119034830 /NCGR_PEP_ID=MMETSP1177-20130426/1847_1 /TAXON_ID=2985 /ORGANISM="Ochromonas sp, Strain CCMP1899" /LENGTH=358 /DNA_ID=CAMNT_0006992583 /DNA_START=110 /DNA_END=1186 /DNA_ORIENTATION=-